MADAHVGAGSTIGSVFATEGAIVPSAIGYDIGCGMVAVETDLTADLLPDTLDGILSRIEAVVPAGVGQGHDEADWQPLVDAGLCANGKMPIDITLDLKLTAKTRQQFGTLGSGNHFIEITLDERDVVWVVLHSGSRGVGKTLAEIHINGAKKLMEQYFINLEDAALAYLVEGSTEFHSYIYDMLWCQDYALANRDHMMNRVLDELWRSIGTGKEVSRVRCHHNFTTKENHHGRNVWVTRKGAIRAREGDLGIIPGSMGTKSYIVRGLGNPASYDSCSHGAGRRLSRGQARRQLTVESLREQMGDRAWNADRAEALLDEHPDSYKDVDQVMRDQADLVEPIHELRAILNFKGS